MPDDDDDDDEDDEPAKSDCTSTTKGSSGKMTTSSCITCECFDGGTTCIIPPPPEVDPGLELIEKKTTVLEVAPVETVCCDKSTDDIESFDPMEECDENEAHEEWTQGSDKLEIDSQMDDANAAAKPE